VLAHVYNNNNNNQAFYSQASWRRLEMEPHETKKVQNKSEKEGENLTKSNKRLSQKSEKDNKRLSQKTEKEAGKKPDKRQ
jgi:hypothetical protein